MSRFCFCFSNIENGGAMRDRTADPLRARQVLSQLSYSPSPGHFVFFVLKAFKILLIKANNHVA